MSPEAILAIIGGLTSFVTALGTILLNRQRKDALAQAQLKTDLADERAENLSLRRYTRRLEKILADNDINLPEKPEEDGDDP